MPLLRIDLQEGFKGDTVIIRVNGKQVFRKTGVTTQLLLGYAEALEIEVPEGTSQIRVLVPNRKLAQTIPLEGTDALHLGVSVQGNQIVYLPMDETMGYA